jgi:hypothetical protein
METECLYFCHSSLPLVASQSQLNAFCPVTRHYLTVCFHYNPLIVFGVPN